MNMKCNQQHGGEYPNNRIVYFCTNPNCTIKLSCGECRYDYHKDHDLVRIQDFHQFAQEHLESSKIVHMDFVINQINNLKQQLLVPIEQFCQSLLQSVPNVSEYTHLNQEDITEDVLNKLLRRQIEVKQYENATQSSEQQVKFTQSPIITQQPEIKSDEEIIQEKGLAEQNEQLQQLVDSEGESITNLQNQLLLLTQQLESEKLQNTLITSENDQLLILKEEQSFKIQELLQINQNNSVNIMKYTEKLQEQQIKISCSEASLDQAQQQIEILEKQIQQFTASQQQLEAYISQFEQDHTAMKKQFDQQLEISLGFSEHNESLRASFEEQGKQIDRQTLEIKLLKAMNESFQQEISNLQIEIISLQEKIQSDCNDLIFTAQKEKSFEIEIQQLRALIETLTNQQSESKIQHIDQLYNLQKLNESLQNDLNNAQNKIAQQQSELDQNNQNKEFIYQPSNKISKILQQQQYVQSLVIDNQSLTEQNRVSAALILQLNSKLNEQNSDQSELEELRQERNNLLANQSQMEQLIQKYRDMLEIQQKPQIQQSQNNHSIDSIIFSKLTNRQQEYFTDSILKSIDGIKVSSSLKLIFRGSRDGFFGQQFAQQCFYICKTIILIKTQNEQTIGCYIPLQLNNYNGFWKKDQSNTTMLFSLTKQEKYNLATECQDKALQTGYTDGYYFLIQLGYQDLYIFLPHSQEQIEQYPPNVFSLFPHSFETDSNTCKPVCHNDYTHDQYLLNAPNSNNRMKRMRIAEMEVYAIQ